MTDFYANSADPADNSDLDSSVIRAEFAAIALGFTKIAGYTGVGNRVLHVNAGGTAQTTTAGFTFDGTTFTAPALAVTNASTLAPTITFTSKPILSSLTASLPVFSDASKGLVSNAMTGTGSVVMSASPTLTGTAIVAALTASGLITANAGLTLGGTASNIATGANFISYGGTDAGLSFDASNNATLSGTLTINGASLTTNQATFTAFAGATTLLTLGGTGATSVVAIPGTKDATNSTTAGTTLAGGLAVAKKTELGSTLRVTAADGTWQFGLAGTTKGLRVLTSSTTTSIQAVDNTLIGSFQPLGVSGSQVSIIGQSGGVSIGGANATGSTTGHFAIPTSAGAPTGVPSGINAGTVAIQYDTTNNYLYFYNGGWKKSTAYA